MINVPRDPINCGASLFGRTPRLASAPVQADLFTTFARRFVFLLIRNLARRQRPRSGVWVSTVSEIAGVNPASDHFGMLLDSI